jgi:hypothetical protein
MPVPRTTAGLIATLAAAATLASGCAEARQVTDGVQTAANTAEVCARSTAAITATFAKVSAAVRTAPRTGVTETQRTVAADLGDLHDVLQPLIERAADPAVAGALRGVDDQVSRWAGDPRSFLRTDPATVDQVTADLTKACTPSPR